MRLLGIDGCAGGWLVAESPQRLRRPTFTLLPALAPLLTELDGHAALVAVDMPIGLCDTPRLCDLAARRVLGPARRSSIFPTPSRASLPAATYLEACALNRAASGKALPRQTFNILRRIAELDRAVTPERQRWLRESHPETTFALLSPSRTGLRWPKRAPGRRGEEERRRLLPPSLRAVDPGHVVALLGRAAVRRDDVVDAMACLVSAWRLFSGRALRLPAEPAADARGLRMEIVA